MGVRRSKKEHGAGEAGTINRWVEICQEQSKTGGSFVMTIVKGDLEDHELIRPDFRGGFMGDQSHCRTNRMENDDEHQTYQRSYAKVGNHT